MNLRPATLAALLLAGCSGAATPDAPAGEALTAPLISAPASASRYALLAPEFGLFAAPKEEALVVAPRWTGERGRGDALGMFRILRHLGEHAGWVALETIPRGEHEAPGSCYDHIWQLESLRLKVYVPRDALAYVTAQRIRQDHPDGTSLELAAGVALIPDVQDNTRWIASLKDLLVPLALMPNMVSTSFIAAPLEPQEWPEEAKPRSVSTTQLATKRVSIGGDPLLQAPAGKSMARQPRPLHEVEERPDGTLRGTLDEGCARLRVALPEQVDHVPFGMLGMLGRGSSLKRRLKAGTPLFWPDGRPAGEVVHDLLLQERPRALPEQRLECFTAHPALTTTLCVKL